MLGDFKLRFEIEGIRPVVDDLEGIAHRAQHTRPLMQLLNRLMQETAAAQFESKGAESGNPWKEDLPSTVRRKQQEGRSTETEESTLTLRDSLIGGSANTIRRVMETYTTYGTRVFYAQYQGKDRQLLVATQFDANEWTERTARYLMHGVTV